MIGGIRDDRGHSVDVDSLNNIYLAGGTKSNNFVTTENAYDTTFNGPSSPIWGDAILSKISPEGELLWSTFFGGKGEDDATEITIDKQDDIIVCGRTSSEDFPILNAYNFSFGGAIDGFMSKFNSIGTLLWSTQAPVVTEAASDPDADGLTNNEEFQHNLDPLDPDTDVDGMFDGWEVKNGLDPHIDDANEDKDEDGLKNIDEMQRNLNVTNSDTDGDGMNDWWEIEMALNPYLNDTEGDKDEDVMPNYWEFQMGLHANYFDSDKDPDEDGLSNLEEYNYSLRYTYLGYEDDLDPHNPDSDEDALPDGWEVDNRLDPLDPDDVNKDSDGDGLSNKLEYQLGLNPQSPLELYAGIFFVFILICLISGFILRTRKVNREAIMLGFENNADKKAAYKAGFKSVQERSEAKTSGFMTAEIYNIVKAAGRFNVEEMVADWHDEFSVIKVELTDEVVQDAIQLILESSSPVHLSKIESDLKQLFDKIEKYKKRVTQISSLQQSLMTGFQTRKTPLLIGLTLGELSSHDDQSASLLQFLTECEDKINDNLTEKRTLFAPWPQLLTLIQITEDRTPVKLSEIAKIVNCSEEQAEHLIILLLKEDKTIGRYNEKEKVYTKGHDVSVLIKSYLKQVRKVIKDFEK